MMLPRQQHVEFELPSQQYLTVMYLFLLMDKKFGFLVSCDISPLSPYHHNTIVRCFIFCDSRWQSLQYYHERQTIFTFNPMDDVGRGVLLAFGPWLSCATSFVFEAVAI